MRSDGGAECRQTHQAHQRDQANMQAAAAAAAHAAAVSSNNSPASVVSTLNGETNGQVHLPTSAPPASSTPDHHIDPALKQQMQTPPQHNLRSLPHTPPQHHAHLQFPHHLLDSNGHINNGGYTFHPPPHGHGSPAQSTHSHYDSDASSVHATPARGPAPQLAA